MWHFEEHWLKIVRYAVKQRSIKICKRISKCAVKTQKSIDEVLNAFDDNGGEVGYI